MSHMLRLDQSGGIFNKAWQYDFQGFADTVAKIGTWQSIYGIFVVHLGSR